MGRGSTVALAAAAAALLVSLPMLLLVSLPAADLLPSADPYEQESRRVFVEWKLKNGKTYTYAGKEECRYAVFKETRRRVAWNWAAWDRAAGPTSSRLNGFTANSIEEMYFGLLGPRVAKQEEYEQETRRMFVFWKAKYGKTYRDIGEERCRYRLIKGNCRVVVRLNAATEQDVYGLNQFGDLTNEEVQQRCYPETDRELSTRCQAAVLDPGSSTVRICERLISYMVIILHF
ncbi:hypothetical protein PAHAL_4G304000 [Panicum hallii]|jgi:hypothetical protein|uniref:Cathepsin propeptide inhibitor domain-containing protein n=1 Tax=Panicum hallii TaxID=206008 RepID=A0A270R6J7_9POAL|nr:oryzain alpha chain-like [Panicum hallii]PAN25472.1 hypothetical protein PAHAL_4G304000 [Panicum hallii]